MAPDMETTAILVEIFQLLDEQQKMLEGTLNSDIAQEYARRSLMIKELVIRLVAAKQEWVA